MSPQQHDYSQVRMFDSNAQNLQRTSVIIGADAK